MDEEEATYVMSSIFFVLNPAKLVSTACIFFNYIKSSLSMKVHTRKFMYKFVTSEHTKRNRIETTSQLIPLAHCGYKRLLGGGAVCCFLCKALLHSNSHPLPHKILNDDITATK